MIYLDNSATTKPDTSVLASFAQVNERYYGNPSSIHELGGTVEKLQTKARMQAADLLKVAPEEVIFTAGGTEANNLAIKGIALEHQHRGKHIITTEIEHAAVYDTCKSLEKLGFTITIIPVDENGIVSPKAIEATITDETILISVMHVNNEIGSIQPIEAIGAIAKQHPKLFFHVDAVQALGKITTDLSASGIDLCSFSGHKINGLKGTGMLFKKAGTTLFPLFHGGGQEYNVRSGTENVAGNVAFVRALRLILDKQTKEQAHLEQLATTLRTGLKQMDNIIINSPANSANHIMNVSVPGVKPETMIHALYEKGIVISTQSACSSKAKDESRVLAACGFSHDRVISGLRISLGYDNTLAEINEFLTIFNQTVTSLKKIVGDK